MRYFFSVLAALIVTISFGQHKNNFQLNGTIEGNYSGKIFLNYVIYDTLSITDSADVDNGKFSLNGFIPESCQGFTHLGIGSMGDWIYLDTGVISISTKKMMINQGGSLVPKLELMSFSGSFSESLRKEFSQVWQQINASDMSASTKSERLFEEMAKFVKKYPAHNLSSSFLSEAALLGYFNYQQTVAMYELLDQHQKDKAEFNGVAEGIKMLNKLKIGAKYEFIAQPDTSGRLISGREFSYEYLLIDFWASWCVPCRTEHPNLIAQYEKYRSKKFEILSVSLDENRNNWIKAIIKDKITWTQVSDLKGLRDNAIAKHYSISFVPSNILIDKEGNIIDINLKGEKLSAKLATLFPN